MEQLKIVIEKLNNDKKLEKKDKYKILEYIINNYNKIDLNKTHLDDVKNILNIN